MLVGVSMFARSFQQYRATRVAGPAKPRSVALVAVGLVVCLGTGVGALVAVVSGPSQVAQEAGSCWNVTQGDQIEAVPCSDDHDYKVSQIWYERALKADPDHVKTWQYYGLWQVEQGNRDQAQYHLSRIAAMAGTNSEEYRSLAAALEKPPGTGLVY